MNGCKVEATAEVTPIMSLSVGKHEGKVNLTDTTIWLAHQFPFHNETSEIQGLTKGSSFVRIEAWIRTL
jgi:hypothetical protein